MKKEDLFESLLEIDEKEVFKAGSYQVKSAPQRGWLKWAALAACAVFIAVIGILIHSHNKKIDNKYPEGVTKVMALYPDPVAINMSAKDYEDDDLRYAWRKEVIKKAEISAVFNSKLKDYYMNIMSQILASDDENTVCSPLNTYFAFAILADVSGGQSREQILGALGMDDIYELRENVKALWESNYADTPAIKSILANSLWLRKGFEFNKIELDILAKDYYASLFSGKPGSKDMNKALQVWTDQNTGGLLKDYIGKMELDPNTVFSIVSTIYYKAQWDNDFYEGATRKETFHGTKGDTEVDMMHGNEPSMGVYRTEDFTAVSLSVKDSGEMHFILPTEGEDVNALLSNQDIFKAIIYEENDQNRFYPRVNMSIPKFRVSAETDLTETMKKLGITDVFGDNADFSSLLTDSDNVRVTKADHVAMVEIDEEGVTGAAYTHIDSSGSAERQEEVIDFILDRPFMFVVTGMDGSILFAGIVRNI